MGKESCRLALAIELPESVYTRRKEKQTAHKFTEAPTNTLRKHNLLMSTYDTELNLVISGDASLTQSAVRMWNSKTHKSPSLH
jgi:predicted RNA-binding protein with PIN domain